MTSKHWQYGETNFAQQSHLLERCIREHFHKKDKHEEQDEVERMRNERS